MSGPDGLARLAREVLASGRRGLLAEIVEVQGSHYRREGARMVLAEDGESAGAISGGCLEADLLRRLSEVCSGGRSVDVAYDMRDSEDLIWGLGLGCDGRVVVKLSPLDKSTVALLESMAPSVSLLVCGSGPDAVPLVRLGFLLGWSVNVVAARSTPVARRRFAQTGVAAFAVPDDLPDLVRRQGTAAVVMTHNFFDDLDLLRRLAPLPVAYLALLGPRRRGERLVNTLLQEGVGLAALPIHAPAGLDIGADSPEEIALAIAAEVQAFLAGRAGGSLRERNGPIHAAEEERKWRAAPAARA